MTRAGSHQVLVALQRLVVLAQMPHGTRHLHLNGREFTELGLGFIAPEAQQGCSTADNLCRPATTHARSARRSGPHSTSEPRQQDRWRTRSCLIGASGAARSLREAAHLHGLNGGWQQPVDAACHTLVGRPRGASRLPRV
jgi:hypothetical protein